MPPLYKRFSSAECQYNRSQRYYRLRINQSYYARQICLCNCNPMIEMVKSYKFVRIDVLSFYRIYFIKTEDKV